MLPVMRSASRLNGILFIVLLAGMFVYSVPSLLSFARQQSGISELFADGQLSRQFEKYYDKRFFLREFSVRQWANLQYLAFGEGSSGAVLGKNGWIFTNQEYLVPNDLQRNLDNQIRQIEETRNTLRDKGIRLIVLPVPMKLDIHAEHTAELPLPVLTSLHETFVQRLKAQGTEVGTVREAMLAQSAEQHIFMRNDTHWSPEGARLAAQVFAQQFPELSEQTPFVSEAVAEKSLRGDLLNFLSFDPRLQPEYFEPVSISVYETLGSGEVTEQGLFGDIPHSIALVGTSYSHMDEWNFAGFLKEALQSDLLNISVEAHGPFQAMKILIDDEALHGPELKTVIWEFPVRTLLAHRTTARVSSR